MALSYKRFVYKLTFPDGKVYIGTTCDVKSRWAGNGCKYQSQDIVWGAISNFGWENVEKEVLMELPPSEKNDKICRKIEIELIRAYGERSYNDPEDYSRIKRYWTINGIEKPAREWCDIFGKQYGVIVKRIDKYGISPLCALTLPKVPKNMTKHAYEYWKSAGCFLNEPAHK